MEGFFLSFMSTALGIVGSTLSSSKARRKSTSIRLHCGHTSALGICIAFFRIYLTYGSVGYPPAEDCGGVMGWDRVKAAFAERKPDSEERELREWAIELMAKPDGSDPFWPTKQKYNPLKEVDLKVLNSARRWNQITNMDYY
ncbi:hypothetical protein PM082_021500 [Marasmius tenuissimus]|nr:hypothetical protein PM082_021500 [Marasmius tenuissimus]